MADDNKLPMVNVKATNTEGKVALWETHPAHVTKDNVTGEVFISGDGRTHTVARTSEVEAKLLDRSLIESNEKPAAAGTNAHEMTDAEKKAAKFKADADARVQADAEARARISKG